MNGMRQRRGRRDACHTTGTSSAGHEACWGYGPLVGVLLSVSVSCSSYKVVPDHLEHRLDRGLTFDRVKLAPEAHQGKLVAWGGEVLSASRSDKGTRIEVLQLPLTEHLHPTTERARSEGRFFAFDRLDAVVDPVVLSPGTPITIVGDVMPPRTAKVNGRTVRYPTLEVRDMTIWDRHVVRRPYGIGYPGGSAFPYYAYGYRPRSFYEGHRVP